MNRKEKAKWFFMGVGAGWLPILAFIIFILIQVYSAKRNVTFNDVRPDIGERVESLWRPSTGNVTFITLGDTGFRAVVGPSYFKDENNKEWDYYTISVEKPDEKHSSVFFERQFKINEIPATLVSKKAKDIVTFDEESGVVTFLLGTSTHKYTLPNRYNEMQSPKPDIEVISEALKRIDKEFISIQSIYSENFMSGDISNLENARTQSDRIIIDLTNIEKMTTANQNFKNIISGLKKELSDHSKLSQSIFSGSIDHFNKNIIEYNLKTEEIRNKLFYISHNTIGIYEGWLSLEK